jgi:hypothetical protein
MVSICIYVLIITILLICYCDCHSILSQYIKEEVCERMTNNWSALVIRSRLIYRDAGE